MVEKKEKHSTEMPSGIAEKCNRTDKGEARDAIGIMFRAMRMLGKRRI